MTNQEILNQIDKLEKAIGSGTTPESVKATLVKKVEKLKSELQKTEEKIEKKEEKIEKEEKKLQSEVEERIAKLEKAVGGIRNLTSLPAVIFLASAKHENTALKEANKKNTIPNIRNFIFLIM